MAEQFEMEDVGNVSVLRVFDPKMFEFEQIDATTRLIDQFLADAAHEKTLLNFNQIDFFNSMCLGLLASLPKKAARHGKSVSFCNLNPHSIWSIQATRLHDLLDLYFDEAQAIEAL